MLDQSTYTQLSKSIVKTLLYYDIFNYPLKPDEILRFIDTSHVDENLIKRELILLRDEGIVFQFGDFFSMQNEMNNVTRRLKGNAQAEKCMENAKQKGELIMKFPFVSAVLASGSLSKGYMDEKSDIDFFIVTQPGRLWISRMLLVMYKRIFLFNSHKYFCVNYFVDTDHLEIEEKNIFTATELATVIPLYGAEYYHQLHQTNSWLMKFFPNYQPRSIEGVPLSTSATTNTTIKRLLERFINIAFGNWLNKFFMNLTLRRWKKLYQQDYPTADFQVAFKSKEYASKNHPNHYQQKVLKLYKEKVKEMNNRLSMIARKEFTVDH